jgi:hypothetical protein
MITIDNHQRCCAAVRRLYCHYNLNVFLTKRSYYAKRVYTGKLLFPLPFTALPALGLFVCQ